MKAAARFDRKPDSTARKNVVRRKCACGGNQQGECEECKRKHSLQRKHAEARDPSAVPSVVHEVLRSSGQPLSDRVRLGMEQRFGHSFDQVRVHAGPQAAESARSINALAYAAGSHIVFGENRYAPGTPAGDRLLAHELTHVVQQQGALISGPLALDGPVPDAAEREAERAETAPVLVAGRPSGVQRSPDEEGELQFFDDPWSVQIPEHRVIPIGLPPEITFELTFPRALEARRLIGEDPLGLGLINIAPMPMPARVIRVPRCDPDRPLTWADFLGTPDSDFSAETSATITKELVGPRNMYRAILDMGASWVKPPFGDPTNRAVNNCADPVTGCQNFYNTLPAGSTVSSPPSFSVPASTKCAASVTLARVSATSLGECESVIGASCDATRVAESNRLLAHEQGHFDITCTFANKANDALNAGSTEAAIDRTLRTKLNTAQRNYDNQTKHGCNAGQQASWEADIAAGLPRITIP